jgi:hypothetical protein
MKKLTGAVIGALAGGLMAMFFMVTIIGLVVDTFWDPSKTDVGIVFAMYSLLCAPIAGACGCILGALIGWRCARSDTNHDDDRPIKYYICPDCAAEGIIPTKDGKCTNCGYTLC